MAQFIIPTIFTASSNMGPVITRIRQDMNMLDHTAARSNLSFKNLTSQIMAYSGAAGVVGAAAAGIVFSGRSLMDYERELANLKALTGVTGQEFEEFKQIITSVATETKMSSVEVAKAFTVVANAMPELLQSADGLGKVTSASILLGKAARMELAPAADAVTTILNQFGKGANDAAKLVDLMAAGSKYGSAEIEDLALSMKEFAAQARLANVSMTESVAITELVSKFRKGTQAGVELRNVLLYIDTLKGQDPKALKDLSRLGVNMSLVADKSKPLGVRLIELSKISNDAAAIFHVFGKENSAMAANVLQNAAKLQPLIEKINEAGVAQAMAAENTNTLYTAVQQMAGKWVTLLTSSENMGMGLAIVGDTIRFVTNNMETLLNIAVPLLGAWMSYKAIMGAVRVATIGYNIVTGLAAGFTSNLSIALMENTVAAKAETIAIRLRTAATWLATEATLAFQIALGGLVVGGLVAFITTMGLAKDKTDMMTGSMDDMGAKFKSIRQPINEATIAMLKYNDAVDAYNRQKDEQALHDYNMKHNPVRTILHDLFTDNPLNPKNDMDTLRAPVMADYFPNLADTANVQTDRIPGYIPPDTSNTQYGGNATQKLNIVIDNKTNNPVSVDDKNTSIPVSVQQTGSYNRR
jgi:TP901 family phage tail tape measure protein